MAQVNTSSVHSRRLAPALAGLLLLAACGASSDREAEPGTSGASLGSDRSGSSIGVDERAVVDVYRRWLQVAHETSVDPVRATADVAVLRARLSRLAGPTVVDAWVKTLLERAANGIAARRDRRGELLDVERVTVGTDEATFVGCVRDAGVLYETASEHEVDAEVGFDRVTAAFTRHGWSWKFDRVTNVEVVAGCLDG
jgi:hypothetical protein